MAVVQRSDDDGLVTLTLDDGKLNALDTAVFHEIDAAFEDASDASAIVFAGRDGSFSAGLNVKTLPTLDAEGLDALLSAFGRTVMRIWLEPRPVVAACTGHAIAGGTMLAMAADHAIAAEGAFRWGLVETQIGFPMPEFGLALARHNVRVDRLDDLILPGRFVDPEQAVEAGYADELAPPGEVLERAIAHARGLMELPLAAYADTKRRLRGATVQAVLANLDHDIDLIVGNRPPPDA